MARQTVLVVEDDRAIRAGITDALDFGGFATSQAATGTEGMDMALREIRGLASRLVVPNGVPLAASA